MLILFILFINKLLLILNYLIVIILASRLGYIGSASSLITNSITRESNEISVVLHLIIAQINVAFLQ